MDIFRWLLDVSNFPRRAFCCLDSPWSEGFSLAYVLAELSIAINYFINPLILFYLNKRYEIVKRFRISGVLIYMYAMFILFCGFGHVLSGVMPFIYSAYHLICVWNFATGLISGLTNIGMVGLLIALDRTNGDRDL